jgi:hypothetical protein
MGRFSRRLACVAALLVPVRAGAQEVLSRAVQLEQRGLMPEASALYAAALREDPGNPAALLGLERVGEAAGWRDSILAFAARALAADSANATAYGVELRTWRRAGDDARAAGVMQRWAEVQPRSEAPYRAWAQYSLRLGRAGDVREVAQLARERLRRPAALAPELAQADAALGQWSASATEWRRCVGLAPQYGDGAALSLRGAPPKLRQGVLDVLVATGDGAEAGRRLAADLLLAWNEPGRAWELLRAVLPEAGRDRADALRRFADRAVALDGPGAQQAAGSAYEELAGLLPDSDAVEARVASARAYAAAGDDTAARRVLRALADTPGADPRARVAALGAMVELQVRAGRPAAAARLLALNAAAFTGTQRADLGREVARAWLRQGTVDSAAAAVAGDASLEADEIRGWVAVYRGALAEGERLLTAVGASGGEARGAARRAATVELLAAVGRDSLPALGAALLLAEEGDTLAASRALVAVARRLETDSGDGEPLVLAWAARFAAAGRDAGAADRLWGEIAQRFPGSAVAPEAELEVARSLARRGDARGAAARLEAMILAHPASALVPEARRVLDQVRGLVPGS